MIDFAEITAAVKGMLDAGLAGGNYTIRRNARRNADPNVAARGGGWINVSRGSLDYQAAFVGAQPWLAQVAVRVEVQAASMKSDEDAEDKLQAAEQAVMNVLTADKKLGGTVDQTKGYQVAYEYNDQERIWHHAAIITILAEVRA